MPYRWCLRVATCVLAMVPCLAPLPALAQTTVGTIDGVVHDADGRVLSGATVVTNSPALIQRDLTAQSDSDGYYRLALLPPGTYEVDVSLSGFQAIHLTGLIVSVGRTTTEDVTLQLATVSQEVTVTATAPLIDPRSAKLAFTYTSALAGNIPTGRDIGTLFTTIPGAESINNLGVYQPGLIEVQNVLGAGERANSYSLDGADITDPAGEWNMQAYMPYDTVAEVQVVKSAKPAEIPFQGGFFNVVTKSGGNALHGEVGGYYSGQALQGTNTGGIEGAESPNALDRSYDASTGVGGRIVADRLWWYGAADRRTVRSRVFGFAPVITNRINSGSGKLTYQANANHRVTAVATAFDQNVSHYIFGFSPSLALDENATSIRPVYGRSYGVTWSGVFGPRLLAELNVTRATHGFSQLMRPGVNAPAVLDLGNDERSQNLSEGTRDQDNENVSVKGSLSYAIPRGAGRHDVKIGFDYLPTTTSIVFDDFQDHRLHTLFGRNFAVRFLSTPATAIWDNDTTSVYAQDDWTLGPRTTLNVGLRFMRTQAGTPEQHVSGGMFAGTAIADRFPALNATTLAPTRLLDWTTIEPRIAASQQLDDRGRTILRLGASRYYQSMPSFNLFVSNPAFPQNYVTRWFDTNGDSRFQIGEEGPLMFSFGGQLNPVDPDLKRPYTDEYLVGLSHEFDGGLQTSANVIYRRDREVVATVDVGVPDSAYAPVDVLDPGPDGLEGTTDDATLTVFSRDASTIGQSRNLLTNPAGNDRTYTGLELTASRRLRDNWQGVASLVISRMKVIEPTAANSVAGLFDTPNGLINARGLDPLNQTVQLKLQGTYIFPAGLQASGFLHYLSGSPYTRELVVEDLPQGPFNVFAEPRGSSRTDASGILDLRLEQRFDLGAWSGASVGVIVDVFNVFNAATVVDYGRITGIDYGRPRSVRDARTARLGARMQW